MAAIHCLPTLCTGNHQFFVVSDGAVEALGCEFAHRLHIHILPLIRLPVLDEGPVLVLLKGDPQLLLGVHDDGAVPGDRLADGLAGNKQEADPILLRGHGHLVAVAVKDDRLVSADATSLEVEVVGSDHLMAVCIAALVEVAFPFNHVSKNVSPPSHRVSKGGSCRNGYIQILGIGDNVLHWPLCSIYFPADDLHLYAIFEGDLRDLLVLHVPVTGVHHLMRGGKVRPELESRHDPLLVTFWHLLMDDAASGGHPLHVTRRDDAAVPHAVAMLHLTLEDIGDRLDAPVGMPGKALEVVVGIVRAEIVEEEERVKLGHLVVAKGPLKMHSCPLDRWLALPDFLNSPYCAHNIPPLWRLKPGFDNLVISALLV